MFHKRLWSHAQARVKLGISIIDHAMIGISCFNWEHSSSNSSTDFTGGVEDVGGDAFVLVRNLHPMFSSFLFVLFCLLCNVLACCPDRCPYCVLLRAAPNETTAIFVASVMTPAENDFDKKTA